MQKLDSEATSPRRQHELGQVHLVTDKWVPEALAGGAAEGGSGNKGARPRPDPQGAHGGDHTTRSEGRQAAGKGPGQRWEGLKVEAEI